jgi:hypothetical protein
MQRSDGKVSGATMNTAVAIALKPVSSDALLSGVDVSPLSIIWQLFTNFAVLAFTDMHYLGKIALSPADRDHHGASR